MRLRPGLASANRRRGGGPTPGLGAHRYWRITNMENVGSTAVLQIAELEFRASVGGADLTGAGTAISNSGTASAAFDNNADTAWTGTKDPSTYIGYDFGAGQAVAVAEVGLRPGTTVTNNRTPYKFDVQYSDDGTTWHNAWAASGRMTDAGVTYAHPYPWTLFRLTGVPASVSIQSPWHELTLRASVGGDNIALEADLISGVTVSFSPAVLFDNNDATSVESNTLFFYFAGTLRAVAEIGFVTRNATTHVRDFALEVSYDGGFTYTPIISRTGLARPGTNVWQYFT